MAADRKKILFITPGAQSFGGNIFLLNFLRWYKKNGGHQFITLYGYPGDLQENFEELSPTFQYFYADDSDSLIKKAAGKLGNHLQVRRPVLKTQIVRRDVGLIYCNAVTNGQMLSLFDSLDVPVITHCHELESLIRLTGPVNFEIVKGRTSRFIAVSDAVRRNLVENHLIADNKITVQHGFIPIANISDVEITAKRNDVRRLLELPRDAFIVGASGTLNWRKAPELFVQIARAVKQRLPGSPIYFVWIGGDSEVSPEVFRLHYDAQRLEVDDRVTFVEHTSTTLDYFAAIDVFAMVSREDPYPLVCLEAASVGKPIICFADAGGMPEFVEEDCGYVVPYLDLDGFAGKIIEMYSNPEKTRQLGENANRKVRARHDIEISAPAIAELMDRYLRR
jgi:glycosyltransferase involved in cell wall biosynthesis